MLRQCWSPMSAWRPRRHPARQLQRCPSDHERPARREGDWGPGGSARGVKQDRCTFDRVAAFGL